MPIPDATLVTVELHLRTDRDQSKPEQLHELACVGLNYLANLGHITRMLSFSRMQEAMRSTGDHDRDNIVDEVDSALFVLGQLQSGIGEMTYGAVTELYELLTKSKN